MTAAAGNRLVDDRQIEEVSQALQRAYDLLEAMGWSLGRVVADYEQKGEEPSSVTLVDIGALASLDTGLGLQLAQLGNERERLAIVKDALDCLRLEVEARAERKAA